MKELMEIQKKLKAPKGQYNSFGKYKYRSCEDILEAVKPLCYEQGCTLTISDELVYIGNRYYIKATATLKGKDGSETVTAYAREGDDKKGMDDSQITGATSSYARKYALNGLFCIDDTQDADTDAYTAQTRKKDEPKEDLRAIAPELDDPAPKAKINELLALIKKKDLVPKEFCAAHGVYTLQGITNAEVGKLLAALN